MRWILVKIRPPDSEFFFCGASIHFHKISLHVHLSARVSPFTFTRWRIGTRPLTIP
jgi:hypothetical protein